MIAKRSRARKDGKSSFAALARYIQDSHSESERLLYSSSTNCLSDDMDLVIKEIEATQALNTRSQADKTYHLIASFHEGERPSHEALDDIEQCLCDAIGLGAHQRVSAVHDNTDHLHLHIAINKVHPETLSTITPFNDFHQLQKACRTLEARHGLVVDAGADKGKIIGAAVQDLEAHQGIESFQGWVQGEPLHRLSALLDRPEPTWEAMHQALNEYGLMIIPRGNGLVVRDQGNAEYSIKASQLGRRFSKGALEQQLGRYTATDKQQAKPTQQYEPAPLTQGAEARVALWNQYQALSQGQQSKKLQVLQSVKVEASQAYRTLTVEYRARRQAIYERKDIRGRKKRAEYSLLRMERAQAQMAIKRQYSGLRETALKGHRKETWIQFLQREANQGNTVAIDTLRRAKKRTDHKTAAYLSGTTETMQDALLYQMKYQVHRNGDVTYFMEGKSVTDEGKRIRIGDAFDERSVETALRMARNQFGSTLKINGSETFQRKAAEVAGRQGMDVCFTDPTLQQIKITQAKQAGYRDPVQRFIDKRNGARESHSDILPHRRYEVHDAGALIYRGQRNLPDGPRVALLEKDGSMLVRPIDKDTASQLKRYRVGKVVEVTSEGIQLKDRGRD